VAFAAPRLDWREPASLGTLALWAAVIGALAVAQPVIAFAVAVVPLALLLLLRPDIATVLAVAALPWFVGLAGGSDYGNSVQYDATDLLLAVAATGIIAPILLRRSLGHRLGDMRTPWLWLLPYTAWLIVVLVAHFSTHSVIKTARAYEVFLLPVVLGAVVLNRRTARLAMWSFVVSSTALAIVWIATVGSSTLEQKNPAGQELILAILVAVTLARDWRARLTFIPLLALGAIFTGSRGAVLGLIFAGIAFLAIRGLGSWRRTLAAVLPLVLVVLLAYNFVPASVQNRLKVLSTASDTGSAGRGSLNSAQYSIALRKAYREDAYAVIGGHPLFGVGTGAYVAGDPSQGTQTADPHEVVLKTAAEQGIPGAALLVVMVLGTGFVLLRRLRVTRWAALALVVQVAAMTHGFVDVYWVRNTPVLGWLLVGMAFNRTLAEEPSGQPAS
jgi:O-antigen ligase